MQDVIAIEGVLWFTLLFGLFVMGPTLILSYLALSSIRAEELYVDADLDRRAEAVAQQVHGQVQGDFERFEQSTMERLRADKSVLTGLADLSPYLRASFRFDSRGNLVAPFVMPADEPPLEPTTAYRDAYAEGRRLQMQGRYADAVLSFRAARAATEDPRLAGEAAFAAARNMRSAGFADADKAIADVYAEFGSFRDTRGFLIGDLANLQKVELALERGDPDAGIVAAVVLVDDLLEATWTIGKPGEATVAKWALQLVEGRADADWAARSRTRRADLASQLLWAETIAGELELVGEARTSGDRGQDGEFVYLGGESRALWATVWWKGDLYAFSFDPEALKTAISESTRRAESLDPEVRAMLLGPKGTAAGLRARSLGPWLPTWAIAVGPADPQLLADKKASKRRQKMAIIAVSVGISAVGVVLAGLLLNREVEGARMKADFAANVSHELRAPITAIRLKGEALQLGLVYDDDDRQVHYDAIVREAERLSRLVDNVLDFSAIERGAKKYTFRPEDIGEIIYNTVESNRNSAESRGIDVEVDVPDDLPVAWVDREAISQVLTNLLSNAAKYGAEGAWVGVRARVAGDSIEVSVSDKGVGISEQELPLVFDRFFRSSDPKIRKYPGTGIGLTIVRYIVESHGGEIGVDSAPGRGTTFTIRLPLERREAGA
jgi:signal transduction histidine kinase